MSPEAQQIAIAKASGWKRVWRGVFSVMGIPSDDFDTPFTGISVPDYLNDLNAIHAAIKRLSAGDQFVVFGEMASIVDAEYPAAFATAAQCCEAFLRALNLWDDSK